MAERKLPDMENGKIYTHWIMAVNACQENDRTENAWHGKWQNSKCTIQKMAENACTGKWQKKHTWKMTERKMHDTENGRTDNAQHGKWQKMHIPENGRKNTPGK